MIVLSEHFLVVETGKSWAVLSEHFLVVETGKSWAVTSLGNIMDAPQLASLCSGVRIFGTKY
jgi:hypothetical protein